MIARTMLGRALAVLMSVGVSQAAYPMANAAAAAPSGNHLVGQNQIARRLLEGARTRQERVKLFQEALSTEEARQKARSMGADPDRLVAAVPHLSDRELLDLSARATQVKTDVVAGHRRHHGSSAALVVLGVLLVVVGIAVLASVAEGDERCDCW